MLQKTGGKDPFLQGPKPFPREEFSGPEACYWAAGGPEQETISVTGGLITDTAPARTGQTDPLWGRQRVAWRPSPEHVVP